MDDEACTECGGTEYRFLDCDECPRRGKVCEEVICIECGASAPPEDNKAGKT